MGLKCQVWCTDTIFVRFKSKSHTVHTYWWPKETRNGERVAWRADVKAKDCDEYRWQFLPSSGEWTLQNVIPWNGILIAYFSKFGLRLLYQDECMLDDRMHLRCCTTFSPEASWKITWCIVDCWHLFKTQSIQELNYDLHYSRVRWISWVEYLENNKQTSPE